VKTALLVFTFAYSLRVVRNTIVTIFWAPCFPVHRQLTTNLVNLVFYLLSEWVAMFFMLRVHHRNYSAVFETIEKEHFDDVDTNESESYEVYSVPKTPVGHSSR